MKNNKLKRTADKTTDAKVNSKINSYKGKYYNQFVKLYTPENIKAIADEMYEWAQAKLKKKEFVFVGDFAVMNMIPIQKFSDFSKESPYFYNIHRIIKMIQESQLVNDGLKAQRTPVMHIFLLKSLHQYLESSVVRNYNIDFAKLTDEQLELLSNGATIEEVILRNEK